MNRYAVSPILPLAQGVVVNLDLNLILNGRVDAPYDGYYTLKGAADDGAVVSFTQGD